MLLNPSGGDDLTNTDAHDELNNTDNSMLNLRITTENIGEIGEICLSMNQSRLRFKSALKYCQQNETIMRANALAESIISLFHQSL